MSQLQRRYKEDISGEDGRGGPTPLSDIQIDTETPEMGGKDIKEKTVERYTYAGSMSNMGEYTKALARIESAAFPRKISLPGGRAIFPRAMVTHNLLEVAREDKELSHDQLYDLIATCRGKGLFDITD
jgi:hypothetical protein